MIVLIGASGGLGRNLVDFFAGKDTMVATYHSTELSDLPPGVEAVRADVCDFEEMDALAQRLGALGERITVVNLSGISRNAVAHRLSPEDWRRVIEVNLTGAFFTCRAFLPIMRERQWGRIINISSVVGQMGVAGTAAYAASKAGILGMTRTLAVENASRNVTVNAIALGYFNAGMIETIPEALLDTIRASIPVGRFGDPDELGRTIEFLIENSFVTGSVLNVNGGQI